MMSTWARRMHRRAATISSVVTICGHSSGPYPHRMEKVKFGVPLDQVCKADIPGPLLVMILKLNKEGPYKKDVFRAPGHQANMKKLIHFLQCGRLVNIDNYSVYTIASVLKKFLRKLPGGIFGSEMEEKLFSIIEMENIEQKRDQIHRLIVSLPIFAQRLLVLLFGTFQVISTTSERAKTGMTAEALGVSVAPSFFQSCVSDGKTAKMEDVMRFKVATRIMKFLIENFGVSNLFGRDNYEFYARITGRILKVEEDWIFSFRYPPDTLVSRKTSIEAEKSWLRHEAERWGLNFNLEAISSQEESQSTPTLIHVSEPMVEMDPPQSTGSLTMLPEDRNSYAHLCNLSLDEHGLFKASAADESNKSTCQHCDVDDDMNLDELRAVNRYAESTKSLSFLPQVHERQTARMKTRSEWFLNPSPCPSPTPPSHHQHSSDLEESYNLSTNITNEMSDEENFVGISKRQSCPPAQILESYNKSSSGVPSSCERPEKSTPLRRSSSKEKRLVRRNSSKSKKDKENGKKEKLIGAEAAMLLQEGNKPSSVISNMPKQGASTIIAMDTSPQKILSQSGGGQSVTDQDCTEVDVHTYHVTLTYKPRI